MDAGNAVASGHHHGAVRTDHGGVLVVTGRKSLGVAGVVDVNLGLELHRLVNA
jgi:hypothetical protein